MLSIVCQHWGDWGGNYAALYVQRLRDAVRRNLGAPHRFVCMMDGAIASTLSEMGIDTLPLGSAELPGNLRKLDMYRPDNGLPAGRVLALDLDTVVTGNLEDIAGYDGRFCVLEDFYEPGRHGGAVVAFEAVTLAESL
ncbi:MAG: hypothetical protein O3A21_07025, partial [Proteobacteria bacterium]|nr:hypothetical protein [Pseudomonadota bacterium]